MAVCGWERGGCDGLATVGGGGGVSSAGGEFFDYFSYDSLCKAIF